MSRLLLHFGGPSNKLSDVYCEHIMPLDESGPAGHIRKVTSKYLLSIKRQYFRDLTSEYAISLPLLEPLLCGK